MDTNCTINIYVYYQLDVFGFPIINFPWLNGNVLRQPSYGIYISQLVRFATCCTTILDFNSQNLQIISKLLTPGYRYHKLRKTFRKFFRSYSGFLSTIWRNIVSRICVWRNILSCLLRWSSLQTKEGQTHCEFRLVGFENSFDAGSMTQWSSGGLWVLCMTILQPCTDLS